ncbi:MAG: hypothetical protein K2J90_01385, partial [Lachnospiraceae bacterium]|nr:hypothetical protein [Lachnospiraceae bacterium]
MHLLHKEESPYNQHIICQGCYYYTMKYFFVQKQPHREENKMNCIRTKDVKTWGKRLLSFV